MKITAGSKVQIEYTIFESNPNGEILEETAKGKPFSFVFGEDRMLDLFEKELEGMSAGERFSFLIPCEEAYGPEMEDAIVEFQKSTFEVDGKVDEKSIAEGEVVSMEDEDGNEHHAIVVVNSSDTVTLDFNHPFAGCDLYFDGEVVSVS